jgi:hypothetical protein
MRAKVPSLFLGKFFPSLNASVATKLGSVGVATRSDRLVKFSRDFQTQQAVSSLLVDF